MDLHRARVRLEWMDEGDHITGWADNVGWNGFAAVWLDSAAIYALDKAAVDAGIGSLYEPVDKDVASLFVERDEANRPVMPVVFFDVQPDGERRELGHRVIDGVVHWDFSGWTFTEILPTYKGSPVKRITWRMGEPGVSLPWSVWAEGIEHEACYFDGIDCATREDAERLIKFVTPLPHHLSTDACKCACESHQLPHFDWLKGTLTP